MSTLVFHIGLHKTGTTALQHACDTNRALLERQGIYYPNLGRGPWHHGLTTPWMSVQPAYALADSAETILARLAADHAGTDHTVLLSSEEFSSGRPDNQVDMARLRAMAQGFDRVRVLCTLRHQVDFIQSIWLEISKKRWAGQWEPFLRQAYLMHRAAGLFLDFSALDRHLRTGFAAEEITYLDYAEAMANPHGSVEAVLRAAGLPVLPKGFLAPPRQQSNVSDSPLLVWFPRVITAPDSPAPDVAAALTAYFIDQFGEEAATTLYTRPQRAEAIRHFEPLNAAFRDGLAAEGRPVPPLAPPEPVEGCVFRDDLRPPFWIGLARMLIQMGQAGAIRPPLD